MIPQTLANRVYTLNGIRLDARARMLVCETRPFALDQHGFFASKLLYSNPLTMWSDIIGYRQTYDSDKPNEFVFVELMHSTATMRLHVLREEPFDSESPDDGISYNGDVYKFRDAPIAASAIAKERLDLYRRSQLPLTRLQIDTDIFWTLK